MKQVNHKFLEEQVRIALKEMNVTGERDFFSRTSSKDREEARETLLGIGTFIKAMLIGADQSYEDVATYLKDMQMYGLGDTKYITKVLDEIPSLATGKNAGLNQTALRFLNVQPFSEANKASLSFRGDIVDYLIGLRDYYVPRLSNADKPAQIAALLKMMLLGSSYSGGVDEATQLTSQPMSLKQAASKYAFEKSGTSIAKILQNDKMPEIPADKEVWTEVTEKNLERYVDYILDSDDMNDSVERLIMSQFFYLRNLTFSQAFAKMATESDLPSLLLGVLSFKYYGQNVAAALMGASDIFLSLGTTIAAVGTGGLAILATTGAKEGLKKLGITAATKWAQTAGKITKNSIESIKAMSTFRAQMLPLGYMIGGIIVQLFTDIETRLNDLEEELFSQYEDKEKTNISSLGFFSSHNDKSMSERESFYENNISPIILDIKEKHSTAMFKFYEAQGLEPSYVLDKIDLVHKNFSFGEKFKNNVINLDSKKVSETISVLKKNLTFRTKEHGERNKQYQDAQRSIETQMKGIENKSNNLEKLVSTNVNISVPDFGKSKSPTEKTSGEALKDIQSSFGSDEKSSAETLRDIQKAFGFEINEETSSQVVAVNVGRMDAIEYAKGTEGFSVENTVQNIEKISGFLKSKGKTLKVTPVAKLTKDIPGVDIKKYNEFIKIFNSHLSSNKYSPMVTQAVKEPENPENKAPEKKNSFAGQDLSGVSGPEILIIGDSTSNNIVNSNKILHRGKKDGRKVGYYGKDGTMYDPKDFSGNHNKALAAAKAAGGGVIFPGWSGHASHGGAGTTYIKNSLVKLLARDESYVPKIAIISMGYNDPPSVSKKGTSINNFKSIISALKERGVKDIRLIEPRADKGQFKKNADLIRPGVYDLADSVVKIVPNPTTQDGGPPRGDGVHYTLSGARRLFKDAMSGLTVNKDIVPQTQTTTPKSVPSKATSEGVPYGLVTSKLGITKAQYDLYRVTLGQRESGQRYNIKGGASGLYDGFYQMGTAAKIDSKIKLPSGASDWNSEIARKYFRENPAVQEEAFGKMTVKNMGYLNSAGKHTERWKRLKQDPATKLGILAVAHLLGHGGAKKFINNNLKNVGADAWGTKDAEYYNLIKKALNGEGPDPSAVADKDPILKTKDSEQTSPEDIKKSGEGFEKALANLREADSYKSFADFFFDIFGLTAGFLDSTNKNMSMVLPEIKNSDLTSFRDKRISFLKDTIHKTNMGTWRSIYKNDIKNAAGDENKIEQAEKKMAYFHRPMFIVRLMLSGLDMFGKSRITFSFEPGSGRIGVNFDGGFVFYKQDFQGSNNLNQFLDILKKYAEASRVVGEKSRALLEEEPENSENIQVYVRFSEIFSSFVDSTIETLSSSSTSSLRKAYSIFVLDRAFVELR